MNAPALGGKRLGSIFNNDINGLLLAISGRDTSPEEYQRLVYEEVLDLKPKILAQNVGMPDPVIYPSEVATTFDKYLEEGYMHLPSDEGTPAEGGRQAEAMRKLRALGTDPFTLTIAACRKRGVAILASYRMNAEDFYEGTPLTSDFGRRHPEWRIPGANCLDPAVPEVYAHRIAIFREVAERYDVDGIEFDFRRWYHMVSDPLQNYPVLTRMVRETRAMLDEVSRRKGRAKLLLGARVGPSLDTDPDPFVFPGSSYAKKPEDLSCRDLGLEVKTWIAEGLVDYLCPALFGAALPGLPKIREFSALAKQTEVGIYPSLWSLAPWQNKWPYEDLTLDKKDEKALAVYKDELCSTALRMYEEGADGISTFNWTSPGGTGEDAVKAQIYPLLDSPAAIRRYREEPWAVPPQG